MNRFVNRTVLGSFVVVTLGVVASVFIVSYFITHHFYQKLVIHSSGNHNEERDRFTLCMQTVMAEARHSGKPIEAADAKEICVHVKDV